MNTKTKALSLLAVVAIAAVAGTIAFSMQSTAANAQTPNDNAVASDAVSSPTSTLTDNAYNASAVFNGGYLGFRGRMVPEGGFGGAGRCGPGGFGQIQVSSDFTANVTTIANADSDVQNLLNSGYNITAVHPIITTTIDGNGNVVTKASNAELILQSTTGRATVLVNLDQAKVTKIVTLTMTEIDK